MDTTKETKLSSDGIKVGIWISVGLILFTLPVLILLFLSQDFHIGMVIGALLFLVLFGLIAYLLFNVSDAYIKNDRVVLKKNFKQPKSYTFDKIGYLTSVQIKRNKYITVEMKNEDNQMEKYLVVNSRSLLSFNNIDAEQVLLALRKEALKKKE